MRGGHPAVLPSREPLDVGFVDDRVMGMPWPEGRQRLLPPFPVGELAEDGHPVVRPVTTGGLTREGRREVQSMRVRITDHLGRHEAVAAAGGAIDLVGVVRRAGNQRGPDHAVPDPAGLVHQRIMRKLQDRRGHVIGAVDQQGHTAGGPRVQREVPRLLRLHPGCPERGRCALLALPCLDGAQVAHPRGHSGLPTSVEGSWTGCGTRRAGSIAAATSPIRPMTARSSWPAP